MFRAGINFISDMRKRLYNAIENTFSPEHYFHFTQAMKGHFDKYLKTKLIANLNYIAKLLPFISEKHVLEVIDEL